MSDQDEIARLLAEAGIQSEETSPGGETASASTPSSPAEPKKLPPRIVGKNNTDVLGVAWFHGALHAAGFRRQKMLKSWSCATPVKSVKEFEAVIDEMLAELEFAGTEMFLLLENESFLHQTEGVPAFSTGAARGYLKGRIQRHQQEHGQVLWVSQPTVSFKDEQSIILHLLPTSFYDELNRVLQVRHLDLTRILPLVVPIQYELNKIPAGKDSPVLTIAETGSTTCVVVARIGGPLLFARTILADVNREATRIGVEVNRSLLFAKQHHDCAIDRIWLMAQGGSASSEISAKCGATRKIVVLPTTPVDWLQTAVKLSPQQPINLLAGYLKKKHQHRLIRTGMLVSGWLAFVFTVLNAVEYAKLWKEESSRLAILRRQEPALNAERNQLIRRNELVEREKSLISHIANDRLPPVPGRLASYLASILPTSARLSDFNVKRESDSGGWSFRVDGLIEADDESARELIGNVQHLMEKSPFRARFADAPRLLNANTNNLSNVGELQHFSMEGVVLEK